MKTEALKERLFLRHLMPHNLTLAQTWAAAAAVIISS
jgi:hypothetical protein